jgi:hypothetical protein
VIWLHFKAVRFFSHHRVFLRFFCLRSRSLAAIGSVLLQLITRFCPPTSSCSNLVEFVRHRIRSSAFIATHSKFVACPAATSIPWSIVDLFQEIESSSICFSAWLRAWLGLAPVAAQLGSRRGSAQRVGSARLREMAHLLAQLCWLSSVFFCWLSLAQLCWLSSVFFCW